MPERADYNIPRTKVPPLHISKIDEPWKKEIQERIHKGFDFEGTATNFLEKGYQLQLSGNMVRESYSGYHPQPDSTILDIVFCRKSDVHKHTRVGELVRMLSGAGQIYFMSTEHYDKSKIPFVQMGHRDLDEMGVIYIPPQIPHAFVPTRNKHLEISLVTLNGKLDECGDKEKMLVPCTEWAPLNY